MSSKKNIVKNGIASFLRKGIKVFQQLFLVPFFITAWGAAYYGEWLTLTIIPTVLAFSDFGFGTAAANSLILSYASGDKQRAANINKSGMFMITCAILGALLVSFIAIFVLDHYQVFEKSLIEKNDAIMAVSVLILARLLNFYSQLFESYFRAARKAALATNLNNIKEISDLILGLLVLLLGYGVVEFALSQLFVIVVFNLYFQYKGKKILDIFKNYKGIRDKQEFKEIGNKGLGYLLSPVWQSIYFQGTTFVVRIVLGAEAVAVFNTVRTLSRSVNQLYSMIIISVFPELQFEIGLGNWIKAQKLFRVAVLATFVISAIGVLFLLLFGMWFYTLWTHNELIVPPYVWSVMVLGILFNSVWWASAEVFRAINEPYRLAIYGLVSAMISVGISYLFAKTMGLVGVAFGCLVLEVLMAVLILPSACKLLKMNIKEFVSHGLYDCKDVLLLVKVKLRKISF
ncbi:lipopolysaccharide biosynthesis protein [Wenyingzhuangia sp. 2_MG-2023]|uniref:lipopolysaccharide biosynthesis protein n=1 Tax=Wenyingzhuangia sp. 2_MG-2023 TaxID=3062639 RepID=UPI0026E19ACD|nr:oligosaccharide flippase family protein [Wenyingzhuangia sp. 2_MG-2023]MDO6739309.1 oligosaccharide flippase family protein [Wenyingzhuangia sp. 2_MG-2023]